MTRLTPKRLAEIAAFADARCPPSAPNMEKARGFLGELIDALSQEKELVLRLLPVEELRQALRGDAIEADTVAATRRVKEEELSALHNGRVR